MKKKSCFRLGEESPPSASLSASGHGAWGSPGSSDAEDCGELQFREFAAELLKSCYVQIVQRHEKDLGFGQSTYVAPTHFMTASSTSDSMSQSFFMHPSGSSNSFSMASQWDRSQNGVLPDRFSSGVSADAYNSGHAAIGNHYASNLRAATLLSTVMDTVIENSSCGSSNSSKDHQDIFDVAPADLVEPIVHTESGLSQLAYGFDRGMTPTYDHGQCDSTTSQSNYELGSSQFPARGLPAWVAKSLIGGTAGDTFLKEPLTWKSWLLTCFGQGPGHSTRKSVRAIVSQEKRAGKDSQKYADSGWACLTLMNAVFVAWELQFFVTRGEMPLYVRIISALFTLVFTIELAIRLASVKFSLRRFFIGRSTAWNIADTFVIACLWTEQVVRFSTLAPSWMSWDVSLLRLFRFAELLTTMCKRMPALREIRLLFRVVGIALRSWFWILVFTSVISYVCSIFLAHGTYPLCNPEDGLVPDNRAQLCAHFGTLGQTFFTCYKAIFGGLLWGDLVEAIELAPFGYEVLFVIFVAFGVIIVANLAAGVLIEVHAEGKRHDIECMIAEEEKETCLFIEAMHEVFKEMDTNQSGAVSKEELELALEDPKMNALLRCYKLEMHDAHLLFDLLDTDNSNTIEVEEFIAGCLKMKGCAQAIDIVRLQIQMQDVHGQVGRWTTEYAADLKHLSRHLQRNSHTSSIGKMDSRHSRIGAKKPARTSGRSSPTAASSSAPPPSLQPAGVPAPPPQARGTHSYPKGVSTISQKSTMLMNMVPTWLGCRIPKVEERGMLVSELRMLRDHIRLHFSTWIDERTRRGNLKLRKVNMYQMNYNWICPLTVPDGIAISGLDLSAGVRGGVLVAQSPSTDGAAPRGIAEIVSATPDGYLVLKVLRGQFDRQGTITCEGRNLGTPSAVNMPTAMSYKELVSSGPSTPTWYCCHWWGEPIIDFLSCMEEHSKLRQGTGQTSYWICAFANSQHDLGLELSDDPETSSFRRAMRAASGVLLVLDSEATPFQRIWCDYELYKTVLDHSKALDIVTVPLDAKGRAQQPQVLADLPGESAFKKTQREAKFPIAVLAKGIQARLEKGEATVQADKTRILNHMNKEFQSTRPRSGKGPAGDEMLDFANQALNAYFAWAAWPQALKNGLVRSFGAAGSQQCIDLPTVTRDEGGRTQLRISLAHFNEVTDTALSDIVSGLPETLTELSLSFEGCMNVSDRALQRLAKGLQGMPSLTSLWLDFLGCKQITDLGLKALAGGLPLNLQRLRLDFAKCRSVGYVGLASLAQALPPTLQQFSCTFKGTLVDQNFESVDELRRCIKDHAPTAAANGSQINTTNSSSLNVRSFFS